MAAASPGVVSVSQAEKGAVRMAKSKVFPSLGFDLLGGGRKGIREGETSLETSTYISLARTVSYCLLYTAIAGAEVQYFAFWCLWKRKSKHRWVRIWVFCVRLNKLFL